MRKAAIYSLVSSFGKPHFRIVAGIKVGAASREAFIVLSPLVMALLGLLFTELQTGQGESRALTIEEVKELPPTHKRFALIIGVDEYQDPQATQLVGAANDAKALASALVRYAGFPESHTILLASDQPRERQPTRGNILQYLANLSGIVPQDGLLLISFAGHGIERDGRGFLCPSDARIVGNIALLEATAIPIETVRHLIRYIGVKQVLIIVDACRNNPAGRGDLQNSLTDRFAQEFNFEVRNREVTAFATIYATGIGNVAYEYKEKRRGYFTWALVEGIEGKAANDRGEVTLGGLVQYLQEVVPKRVHLDLGRENPQKPYASVEGYKADELVISVTSHTPGSIVGAPHASTDPTTIELEFWDSIKASKDPQDFKAYLEEYQDGHFASLAKNRIRQLESRREPWSEVTGPGYPEKRQPSLSGATRQEDIELKTYTEIVNGVPIEMVRLPAGRFLMGSPSGEGEPNERPQHQVNVSSFDAGKYEVTQAQWRAVARLPKARMNLNPDPSHFKGQDLPVQRVSWKEVVEFCDRLSRATKKTYRLPTEAEWEYACRAWTTTPYSGSLDQTSWYGNNSGKSRLDADEIWLTDTRNYFMRLMTNRCQPQPVGRKNPNAFGLHDVHGNVWEWCTDWYSEDYYAKSEIMDPKGTSKGSERIVRGGSWNSGAYSCRSAFRLKFPPNTRFDSIGFRLVTTLD